MRGVAASVALGVGLTIVTGSTAFGRSKGQESQHLVAMGDDFLISPEEVRATEDAALGGSAVAAEALWLHHMELVTRTTGSQDEVDFWERIAAENGSCLAQESYAARVSGGVMEHDDRKIKRAAFWRRKAQECRDAERKEKGSSRKR